MVISTCLFAPNSVGDGMWGGRRVVAGEVALPACHFQFFRRRSTQAPASNYRRLPKPQRVHFPESLRGRLPVVRYRAAAGGYPQQTDHALLHAVHRLDGRAQTLPLVHGVDRIEVKWGRTQWWWARTARICTSLQFIWGSYAGIVDRYTRKGASEWGALQSLGSFYKPDGLNSGTLLACSDQLYPGPCRLSPSV